MFARAFTSADFDVTELSFSRHIANAARGTSPYVGIPVFTSRVFRHSAIYIRTDRGITKPEDLRRRGAGVREYANTASLVARGMLEDEYGVRAHDLQWRVGDVDHSERAHIKVPTLPDEFDVQVAGEGRLLSEILVAGELDLLVDYQPPRCFNDNHPLIARLFPDHEAAERDYFARTGMFPIMHLIEIRRGIVEREPWVAASLLQAFTEAKDAAVADLWSPGALKISLPWVSEELTRTRDLMGGDFWPYGIEPNRAAIESLTRYAHAQGLTQRQLTIAELFAASVS
jgi:4,5-dihydroxyphthalate decarboxylase